MVFHLGIATWAFFATNVIDVMWQVIYAYGAFYSYMSLHKCVIYLYFGFCIFDIIQCFYALKSGEHALVKLFEIVISVTILCFVWRSTNEFSEALQRPVVPKKLDKDDYEAGE